MNNNRLAIQIYGKPFEQLTIDQKEKIMKKEDNDAWLDKIFLNIDKEDWINKGIALDSLGKHEEAPICYDKALEINSKDDNILFNKACYQKDNNNIHKKINNMKIFCKMCGAELKEYSDFCSSCGFGIIGQFFESFYSSLNWSGRFSRRQFVIFYIDFILINLFIAFLIGLTGFDVFLESIGLAGIAGLTWLAISVIFIYSAVIRRFHDLDKSGWYVLLSFIPLVNFLVLIYLFTKQGKGIGETRWDDWNRIRIEPITSEN